jgi:hypothetical protein
MTKKPIPEEVIAPAAAAMASSDLPAGSELSEEALDRAMQKMSRRQEDVQFQKDGLQLEPILLWESTAQLPRESRLVGAVQHSDRCLCDKSLQLSKYVLPLDVIETCRGDRPLSNHGFRLLSEEEVEPVSQTNAPARSLQAGARIRKLQAQRAKPESDLRRVRSELSNSREVAKSILERCEQLEVEIAEKEAAVERAGKPLEKFFNGKSEAWKEKALAESVRADRDALPAEPPEKARAHFPQPAPGDPKVFTPNKETGVMERVR